MSDWHRSRRLYRAFREAEPRRVGKVTRKTPSAVMVMGHCEFIGYATTHRGRPALYIHEFAPGSRPLLCAGTGRGQLYLVKGRFKVTSRGITDMDARGRFIDPPPRYKVVRRRR